MIIWTVKLLPNFVTSLLHQTSELSHSSFSQFWLSDVTVHRVIVKYQSITIDHRIVIGA
jgi:hypothetical protein